MSIMTYSVHVYVCTCDDCDKSIEVKENKRIGIYNAAQAVRSLGWSFGKDKSVRCDKCRQNNWEDKHRYK